jgi:hypothetical protein
LNLRSEPPALRRDEQRESLKRLYCSPSDRKPSGKLQAYTKTQSGERDRERSRRFLMVWMCSRRGAGQGEPLARRFSVIH